MNDLKTKTKNDQGQKSYQYSIPAPSKGERATFPFDLTQVRSSGGVWNPGRFLVGWLSQAHTMGAIPCWFTSFPPTKKKKQDSILSVSLGLNYHLKHFLQT